MKDAATWSSSERFGCSVLKQDKFQHVMCQPFVRALGLAAHPDLGACSCQSSLRTPDHLPPAPSIRSGAVAMSANHRAACSPSSVSITRNY